MLPQDFLLFDRPLDVKSVAGIVLTMAGVFAYTHLKLDKARREKEASISAGTGAVSATAAASAAAAAKSARLEELVSPTSVAAGGVGSTLRAGGGEVEALLGAPGGGEEEPFSPVERERDATGRGGLTKSATD